MGCRPLYALRVRSSDPMPTFEVLARVRRAAWDQACARAFGLGWPPTAAIGADLADQAGLLALGTLIALCPKVPRTRLAACLRLPPETVWAVTEARRKPTWLRATASAIAAEIRELCA